MFEAGGSRHRNYNSNMSTAAVFLDIEKAFDTTWHSGSSIGPTALYTEKTSRLDSAKSLYAIYKITFTFIKIY
jgi:hypothetical protein